MKVMSWRDNYDCVCVNESLSSGLITADSLAAEVRMSRDVPGFPQSQDGVTYSAVSVLVSPLHKLNYKL